MATRRRIHDRRIRACVRACRRAGTDLPPLRRSPATQGFIKSTTAAAAGAIAGAAIVIAAQPVKTPLAVAIAAIALGLLVQPWGKVPEPAVVALAAAAGLLFH
jgi:chromate transporter